MFSIGEGMAGGKHVGPTADQSAKAGEKVDSKVKENGVLFDLNQSSALAVDFVS